jgi:hypothetical protein
MTPQRALNLIDSAAQYAMVFDCTGMQAYRTLHALKFDLLIEHGSAVVYDYEDSMANLEKWQCIRQLRDLDAVKEAA